MIYYVGVGCSFDIHLRLMVSNSHSLTTSIGIHIDTASINTFCSSISQNFGEKDNIMKKKK